MPKKLLLLLSLLSLQATAQVSISLQNSDLAMIPGSKRTLYAKVQGTKNLGVNWTVMGGTISAYSTNAAPVVVTAPSSGSTCSYVANASGASSFTSATSVVVTATSAADSSKSVSRTIPVCNPQVMLTTFPMSIVRYQNQYAVIQSDLRGSVNTNVTWAITGNPGGAGTIVGGTANRSAVFTATAAGTYTLTATSVADKSKKSSTTIYVTGHALPSVANADHAEAVDCTAVGSGKTYDVGPLQGKYHTLNDVPWTAVTAGDTVRIHNDDTTGMSPTTYRQYVSIAGSGNATQPLRVCGVPDADGNKPVISGDNATTRSDENWAGGNLLGLGLITLYDSAHKVDATQDGNHNIIIEGLKFVHANPNYSYVPQGGGGSQNWSTFAGCIRSQTGFQVLVLGNDLGDCSQGYFMNSVTPMGAVAQDMTVEGNALHDWGLASQGSHGLYLQAIGLTVQFNYFGASNPAAQGNLLKTRSVMNFVRWNFFDVLPSNARSVDMVEPQAFSCYTSIGDFARAYHGTQYGSDGCYTPNYQSADTDPTTADYVAANNEAYHFDYVYGNVIKDEGSASAVVHYGYDQQTVEGPLYNRRGGTLNWYGNTVLATGDEKGLYDMQAPDAPTSGEYPVVYGANNLLGGANAFRVASPYWAEITTDTTWITTAHLPYRCAVDQYQGGATTAEAASCDQYGHGSDSNGHLVWARNGTLSSQAASLFSGTAPINPDDFTPASFANGLARSLPTDIANLPNTLEYYPTLNRVAVQRDHTNLGALEGVARAVSIAISPAKSTIAFNQAQTYTCTTTLSDGSTRACVAPTLTSSNRFVASTSGLKASSTTILGGSVVITASAEGFTSTASLKVSPIITLPTLDTKAPVLKVTGTDTGSNDKSSAPKTATAQAAKAATKPGKAK